MNEILNKDIDVFDEWLSSIDSFIKENFGSIDKYKEFLIDLEKYKKEFRRIEEQYVQSISSE